MSLHAEARFTTFQQVFDLVNAPARPVQFVTQQLVGGTGGIAESTMHTTAQHLVGFLAERCVFILFCKPGLHR
jgi:hypothetical protein